MGAHGVEESGSVKIDFDVVWIVSQVVEPLKWVCWLAGGEVELNGDDEGVLDIVEQV